MLIPTRQQDVFRVRLGTGCQQRVTQVHVQPTFVLLARPTPTRTLQQLVFRASSDHTLQLDHSAVAATSTAQLAKWTTTKAQPHHALLVQRGHMQRQVLRSALLANLARLTTTLIQPRHAFLAVCWV